MSKPWLPGTQTTTGTWGRILSECLKDANVDPRPLFEQVDLDYDESIAPDTRIPDAKLRHLYPLAIQATNSDSFSLQLGAYVKAHSFHALGMAILVSKTVGDALQRFQRHSAIISDSGYIDMIYVGDNCRFDVNVDRDIHGVRLLPYDAINAFMFGVVNMMREITEDFDLSPVRVELCEAKPLDTSPYEKAFSCPVEFDRPKETLMYSIKDMAQPVRYANESLAKQHDQITESFIKNMSPAFEDELYRQILNELPNGELSVDKLASSLNMSLRKLQGKLQQQNTSYQQLLDKARKELASKYLTSTNYSITEVSFLLGFANSAGFCRAFKRWFECSPTDYRLRAVADS
ncbi:AraC family transcriptional regulator [Zhongshania aquimaris]|uniref:AraC family transcriptional regulator n=1 Tax=Zhongshania aquimaris TaxID=2857107 RepID=A0ABS6VT79_9GAMM|nr:AraC family transcriptional regulator [Zhongshania aquimaris]MBW2941234.1 AraC family transcriptional regulator [Zhongshania aquimaris]